MDYSTGTLKYLKRGQDPVEELNQLRASAERYIRYPQRSTGVAVSRWRNKCLRWLADNVPESGLREELLAAPPSSHDSTRLTLTDVRSVQKCLAILLKGRDLLPALFPKQLARLPRAENVRRVFIVHGHNETLKVSAARLVSKLGLEPVILHEQPDRGRTVIEKLLDYADCAFALVLLTADDRGGLAGESSRGYRSRARQNVILELGYFIGRIGREKVAAIYEEGVEIPSDYRGVIFIPYDNAGAWQVRAVKEMRAAGIKVDLNPI
jgi:predicted nucleotide-binding protein